MKRGTERAVTWFLLVFFAVFLDIAWGYSSRARLVPLVVLIPALILTAVQLWQSYRAPDAPGGQAGKEEDELELEAPFDQEMRVLGCFVFAVVLLWFSGFLIGMPVFLAIFLRWWGKESWPLSLSVAGLVTLGTYLSLEIGFHLVLYRGWLFSLI